MPFEFTLNAGAILSAAFICFSLSALWFSKALFGPLLNKFRPQKAPVTLAQLSMQFLFILIFCIVMEIVVDTIGAVGMRQGVSLGIAVWLLISLMHLAVAFKFDLHAFVAKSIYSGYFLAASVISATLLSMWR